MSLITGRKTSLKSEITAGPPKWIQSNTQDRKLADGWSVCTLTVRFKLQSLINQLTGNIVIQHFSREWPAMIRDFFSEKITRSSTSIGRKPITYFTEWIRQGEKRRNFFCPRNNARCKIQSTSKTRKNYAIQVWSGGGGRIILISSGTSVIRVHVISPRQC